MWVWLLSSVSHVYLVTKGELCNFYFLTVRALTLPLQLEGLTAENFEGSYLEAYV